MTFSHILIFTGAALIAGWLSDGRGRRWLMLVGSVLALYWLQSALPIRRLDFWLPTATLTLTVLTWALTFPRDDDPAPDLRQTLITAAVIGLVVIGLALTRFIQPLSVLTPSRPPQSWQVIVVVMGLAALAFGAFKARRRGLALALSILLVAILIVLKLPPAAEAASTALRSLNRQPLDGASPLDLSWLGISYVAFRLIHTLLDRWYGRLPALSLRDFMIFVIFFPAITAGPIDKVQRFTKDLDKPFTLNAPELFEGGSRVVLGMFLKFALADTLALISLDASAATQVQSAGWLWVTLYAYSFRLFWDFAGYTHIAIGIGRLMGITLPENFDNPYLKGNLTVFWNSWHITLAMWFRAYFFNPVSRAMRVRKLPVPFIIAFTQITTMLLIGLWHGISWNYIIWGVWHGIGLFINNRWQQATRAKMRRWNENPRLKTAITVAGALITFHFVALGWVWFALPSVDLSVNVLLGLFGL